MRIVSCDQCSVESVGQSTWNALAFNMTHIDPCNYHGRTFTAVQNNPYFPDRTRSAQLDKDGAVI